MSQNIELRYDLDLERFWKEDAIAHRQNCFDPEAKQVALGLRMSQECVFAELGEEGNPWGHTPAERMLDLCRRYNDRAEIIVGRRLLGENPPSPADANLPGIRGIGDVFGGYHTLSNGVYWLESDMKTPQDLEKTLDQVEAMDLRDFILPKNWEEAKKRVFEKYGKKPAPFRGIRGPVTLAMSLYGVENTIYLIMDEPDLAARFRDAITNVIMGVWRIMNVEAGLDSETPSGFSFNDDNCCMLSAPLYEFFGYPILKKVFETCAPSPEYQRYQHSDSDMGHLLPLLGDFNMAGVNFGPTVTVREIRKYMPRTRIDGQLAPFTLMRNNEEDILAEVRRDCEAARECGRGLNLATAGSVNNGSLLTSMRAVMYAIQEYGQY